MFLEIDNNDNCFYNENEVYYKIELYYEISAFQMNSLEESTTIFLIGRAYPNFNRFDAHLGNAGELNIRIYTVLDDAVVLEIQPKNEEYKLEESFFRIPESNKYLNNNNLLFLKVGDFIKMDKRYHPNFKNNIYGLNYKIGVKSIKRGQMLDL